MCLFPCEFRKILEMLLKLIKLCYHNGGAGAVHQMVLTQWRLCVAGAVHQMVVTGQHFIKANGPSNHTLAWVVHPTVMFRMGFCMGLNG